MHIAHYTRGYVNCHSNFVNRKVALREWIEKFIKDPKIPKEYSASELALLPVNCSTAEAECLKNGCDKASEVQHIFSLEGKWLPFKNMTVQAG